MSGALTRRVLPLLAAVVAVLALGLGSAWAAGTPTRIVSLSPTATDTLFAVGAGKQVVAVDSLSTYPKAAPVTDLSAFTPNAEAIAKYKPDLVVISDDMNHIVDALGKLKIPVLVSGVPKDVEGAYAGIQKIGDATGHGPQAAALVKKMKAQIAALVKATPRPATPLSFYHELDQTYYSITSNTFIGQLYGLLGLQNIADKAKASSDYPQLSAEYIVASNPKLIVLADTVCCSQTKAKVQARPGWSNIDAVKTGSVVLIDDNIASQWGPRIVNFLRALSAAARRHESK